MRSVQRLAALCITGLTISAGAVFAIGQAPAKTAPPATPPAKTAKAAKSAKAPAVKSPEQGPAPDAQAGTQSAKKPAAGERDPFAALISEHKEGSGPHLPPGKAGLVVATVRVDGTVKDGNQMLAVVSNPEEHVYFIREGDKLYDGDVEKIGLDGVTFREDSKDAFGKPIERMVTKRIFASAGEQQ